MTSEELVSKQDPGDLASSLASSSHHEREPLFLFNEVYY